MVTVSADHRPNMVTTHLDACKLAPTRTPATIAHYRKGAAQLVARSRPGPEADDAGRLAHAIGWYADQHAAWSKSTIRSHRAALRQAIYDLEDALGAPPALVADLLLRLLSADPESKPVGARKATSARKRKSFQQAECRLLIDALANKRTNTARILTGLLAFGPYVGLRPIEWRDAVLRGDTLFVRCAKNTNRRGVAAFRMLVLVGFNQDALSGLGLFLAAFKKGSSGFCVGGFWLIQSSGRLQVRILRRK